MKKTLVALAVAAVAATSANAVVVYNENGTKVEVEGSVRLILEKANSKADGVSTDKRVDLKDDGSRLWVKASQDLGNGLAALGGLELRFNGGSHDDNTSNSSFGNPTTRQLFAGFSHADAGTVTFGRQETTLDAVQLSDFAYVYGGNNNLTGFGFKSIKFKSADFNGFSFGVDYIFGDSARDKAKVNYKYGYGLSAFYSADLGGVKLNAAAGYGQDRYDGIVVYATNPLTGEAAVDADGDKIVLATLTGTNNTVAKKDSWRLATQVEAGPAAFGLEYGQSKTKVLGYTVSKTAHWLVGAKYQVIEPTTVYAQYKHDVLKAGDNKWKTNTFILGADYKFNKHVVTFLEYAHARKSNNVDSVKVKDNKVAAGLRVFF